MQLVNQGPQSHYLRSLTIWRRSCWATTPTPTDCPVRSQGRTRSSTATPGPRLSSSPSRATNTLVRSNPSACICLEKQFHLCPLVWCQRNVKLIHHTNDNIYFIVLVWQQVRCKQMGRIAEVSFAFSPWHIQRICHRLPKLKKRIVLNNESASTPTITTHMQRHRRAQQRPRWGWQWKVR